MDNSQENPTPPSPGERTRPEGYDHRTAARFWPKVRRTDHCWIWTGALTPPSGYGTLWDPIAARPVGAHIISYRLHHGPIPPGHHVIHACDTPWCVNPDHLTTGTRADNMRDMVLKQRSARGTGPGTGRGAASRLPPDQQSANAYQRARAARDQALRQPQLFDPEPDPPCNHPHS